MNKKINVFIFGIIIGFLSFLTYQNYSGFLVISTNEAILEVTITVLSSVLAVIFSTTVAFLVASYQMKKEKENIAFQIEIEQNNTKKEEYINNLRFLKVLKYEFEINLINVDKAVKSNASIDPKILLPNLDNIFSMNSWDILYLKIDVSEECYNEISKLYRIFRKIKGTPETEFKVIKLADLSMPLTQSIQLINSDMVDLNNKIKQL